MKYIFVPEDTYSVNSPIKRLNSNFNDSYTYTKDITISGTKTAEKCISELIQKQVYPISEAGFTYETYLNKNWYTLDHNYTGVVQFISNSSSISSVSNWCVPLQYNKTFYSTYNYPVTRTISLLINSNTLPIYNVDKDINLKVKQGSRLDTIAIPKGNYTWSSFNNIFLSYLSDGAPSAITEYYKIRYFKGQRLIPKSQQTGLWFYSNEDFDKYYGLLHTVITYPESANINTTNKSRRYTVNWPPQYRSLHIPSKYYEASELINYINNNSLYHYTRNNVDSSSVTDFLAKEQNNNLIIYTTDGSQFYITPICYLNTFHETNWSTEHKLCTFNEVNITYTDYEYDCYDTVNIIPTIVNTESIKLTLSATGLPDGLTINTTTGIITGIITPANRYTNYNINITCKFHTFQFSTSFNINIIRNDYNCNVNNNCFIYPE